MNRRADRLGENQSQPRTQTPLTGSRSAQRNGLGLVMEEDV